jgi:hypothetical protein
LCPAPGISENGRTVLPRLPNRQTDLREIHNGLCDVVIRSLQAVSLAGLQALYLTGKPTRLRYAILLRSYRAATLQSPYLAEGKWVVLIGRLSCGPRDLVIQRNLLSQSRKFV